MKRTIVLIVAMQFSFGQDVFAATGTPRLISYISATDGNTDWANPDSPYTHYILSFIVQTTPDSDPTANLITAGGWTDGTLNFNDNNGIVDTIHNAGKKAMIAYGGATMDWNYYHLYVGKEAQLAQKLAQVVRDNNLDGIDIDWEDTAAFTLPTVTYNGRQFLIDLTTELRNELPAGQYEISHAPQPPYLDASQGSISGYSDVMAAVGEKIDFLNMQYYNNTPSDPAGVVQHYTNAINSGLLTPEQLVVGKPVTPQNAGSGYIPVEDIRDDIVTPLVDTYGSRFGGVFNWEFKSDANFQWGYTVASAFPVPEPSSLLLALIGFAALVLAVVRSHSGMRV